MESISEEKILKYNGQPFVIFLPVDLENGCSQPARKIVKEDK